MSGNSQSMIRRHLALSIALASILSLIAGGLAYAALTPEAKVSVCVNGCAVVRDAPARSPSWNSKDEEFAGAFPKDPTHTRLNGYVKVQPCRRRIPPACR